MQAVVCKSELCFITAVKGFFPAGNGKSKKEDKQYVTIGFHEV